MLDRNPTDKYYSTNSWLLFITAMFVVASVPFFWNCYNEKFFSADAAFYFTGMLDQHKFMDFAWSRNHAIYITEWPIMLALNAGVTDLTTLKFMHGFGLYFPCLIGFLLTLLFCDNRHRHLLVVPVLSMFLVSYPADNIMTGESHVLAFLSWPLLFALMSGKLNRPAYAALTFTLIVAYTRLYESAIFTTTVLLGVVFYRLWKKEITLLKWATFSIITALLVVIAIAVAAILFPRDPNNRSDFIGAIVSGLAHPTFVIALLIFCGWLIGYWTKRNVWILLGFVLGAVLFTYLWISGHFYIPASISFASRTLTFTVLPVLMTITAGIALLQKRGYLQERRLLEAVVLLSIMHMVQTASWVDYKNQFTQILESNTGFVHVEDTPLDAHPQKWYWTNPMLSYLWSKGDVHTIVLNAPGNYEPYKAMEEPILKEYKRQTVVIRD